MEQNQIDRFTQMLRDPELRQLVHDGFKAQHEWTIRMGYVQAVATLVAANKPLDEAIELAGAVVSRVCASLPPEVFRQPVPLPLLDDPAGN